MGSASATAFGWVAEKIRQFNFQLPPVHVWDRAIPREIENVTCGYDEERGDRAEGKFAEPLAYRVESRGMRFERESSLGMQVNLFRCSSIYFPR